MSSSRHEESVALTVSGLSLEWWAVASLNLVWEGESVWFEEEGLER